MILRSCFFRISVYFFLYFRTMACWVYLLNKYPDTLLTLEMLADYKNSPVKQYAERSKRTENISAKDDLTFNIAVIS
jgi:hypothetical protein